MSKVHSLSESFKSESPSFGKDISAIHHVSDASHSMLTSSLKKEIFQPTLMEKTITEMQNLHHEGLFMDLKGEF